jgi:hypothetical protein
MEAAQADPNALLDDDPEDEDVCVLRGSRTFRHSLQGQGLEELHHMNGHEAAVDRSSDSEQPRSAEARRISCVCVARPENDGEENETLETTNKRLVLHTPKAALRSLATCCSRA